MDYTLSTTPHDGGFIVTLSGFDGLSAWGETPEEAILEFSIALKLYMEVMIEDEEECNA